MASHTCKAELRQAVWLISEKGAIGSWGNPVALWCNLRAMGFPSATSTAKLLAEGQGVPVCPSVSRQSGGASVLNALNSAVAGRSRSCNASGLKEHS